MLPQIAGLTALDRTQVLQQLHREEHVDVARQVDVFEKEMQADNEEIAHLSMEEQKKMPDQPSSLDLDSLSLTSPRQSEAANKANTANSSNPKTPPPPHP